jgi:hypothetical protein
MVIAGGESRMQAGTFLVLGREQQQFILKIVVALITCGGIVSCAGEPELLRSDGSLNITPYSIAELFSRCSDSDFCGIRRACEGSQIVVRGFVDPASVVSRRSHPLEPQETFRLFDQRGDTILVHAAPDTADQSLFRKVAVYGIQGPLEVILRGRLQGYDVYIMGACRRGVRLVVEREEDIVLVHGDI